MPDATLIDEQQKWNRASKWAFFGAGGLFLFLAMGGLGYLVMVASAFDAFARADTDTTTEVRGTWKKDWAGLINVPVEATLIQARKESQYIDQIETFEFTLPNTKKPADWLAQMTKGQKLAAYKESSHKYDAGYFGRRQKTISDFCRLEYSPSTGVYTWEFGSG